MLTNVARTTLPLVVNMPNVRTLEEVITASVTVATMEMDSLAQVGCPLKELCGSDD